MRMVGGVGLLNYFFLYFFLSGQVMILVSSGLFQTHPPTHWFKRHPHPQYSTLICFFLSCNWPHRGSMDVGPIAYMSVAPTQCGPFRRNTIVVRFSFRTSYQCKLDRWPCLCISNANCDLDVARILLRTALLCFRRAILRRLFTS